MKKVYKLLILSIIGIFSLTSCLTMSSNPISKELAKNIETDADLYLQQGNYWNTYHYVDEFNDETADAYISNNFFLIGNYSDANSSNNIVTANIFIQENTVKLQLARPALLKENPEITGIIFTVSMKTDNEEKEYLGTATNNKGLITLNKIASAKIILALAENQSFKLALLENGSSDSGTYLVTIPDSTGFAKVYMETYPNLFD